MSFQTSSNDQNNRDKLELTEQEKLLRLVWQGLESGNITFSDELDFDIAEIEQILDDSDMEDK